MAGNEESFAASSDIKREAGAQNGQQQEAKIVKKNFHNQLLDQVQIIYSRKQDLQLHEYNHDDIASSRHKFDFVDDDKGSQLTSI